MAVPDPNHMITYCGEILPKMLVDACEVEPELASRVGEDVLARAEAFATLSEREQDVLVAPFVEEVFDHDPQDSSLDLKAKVTIVVRNSLLEEAHHDGPVRSGLIAITKYAAGPLSHFLAARRSRPIAFDGPNPFRGLPVRYPRAWACLSALTDAFAGGGRLAYRLPTAPIPELPAGREVLETTAARDSGGMSVFSGIDERFDQRAVDQLRQAMSGDFLLGTSALSRYSRNSAKLHRTLEFVLAHRATILTTNYLIRPADVWVRRGQLVKPVSHDPGKGIGNTQGLSGAHRKLAETIAAQLR